MLTFENVESQPTKVDDPLDFTCQVRLGLVDVEGWRYAKIVWLSDPEPPPNWLERRKEAAKGCKAAEQGLTEDIQKENKRNSFDQWSQKSKSEARDFAGFLGTARALLRRYLELVTAETFPAPFRLAWEEAIGTTDPDGEIGDYGDLHLIKEGLLISQDARVSAAAFTDDAQEKKGPAQQPVRRAKRSAKYPDKQKTHRTKSSRRK